MRKRDGEQVAIKFVRKTKVTFLTVPENGTRVPKEVALMLRLPAHTNVCQLLDWLDGKGQIALILERPQPCIDLAEYCHQRRPSEQEASAIMRQVVLAAKHCHDHGVLHRDIKPQNILINTDTKAVKLIDFGCGDFLREGPYTSFSGTWAFMPPELFVQGSYGAQQATVWSLGVLLYYLVKGVLPFYSEEDIVEKKIRPRLRKLSPDCRNLVLTCLRKDPAARPSLDSILRHRWLGGGD
ncbi:serine/threonine-protein kinase pim-2-like [Engraulis encrasicolus]|uniref:serine/threonine-protein kinase pim-2-like n=1 Tax=Engraulis encrasicolus TaxID=184585 RepID=UPI002FD1AF82